MQTIPTIDPIEDPEPFTEPDQPADPRPDTRSDTDPLVPRPAPDDKKGKQ